LVGEVTGATHSGSLVARGQITVGVGEGVGVRVARGETKGSLVAEGPGVPDGSRGDVKGSLEGDGLGVMKIAIVGVVVGVGLEVAVSSRAG
jgi:hypothetical protein